MFMLDRVWYLVKREDTIELPTRAFVSLEAAKRAAEKRVGGGTWKEAVGHGECYLYTHPARGQWSQYIIPLEIQRPESDYTILRGGSNE
jgi:hypothetical protein